MEVKVVITQEDREAAAGWVEAVRGDSLKLGHNVRYRNGKGDGSQLVQAFARHRIAAIEECAKVCEGQQQIFLSEEYAVEQPLSSFKERFACGQCAEEIRKLAL
jgi:hypothetical protein